MSLPKKKITITIGFFSPQDNNTIFNKLASCWTARSDVKQTYSHVELRFGNGAITSVTKDPGYVHYETDRLLSNSGYRCFFEIDLDPSLEIAIREYAMKCANAKVPFNGIAVYWNFLPLCSRLPIYSNSESFFCSEYIATLLQMVHQCPLLTPALTSPNDLYASLKMNPQASITFNKTLFKARNVKLLSD